MNKGDGCARVDVHASLELSLPGSVQAMAVVTLILNDDPDYRGSMSFCHDDVQWDVTWSLVTIDEARSQIVGLCTRLRIVACRRARTTALLLL